MAKAADKPDFFQQTTLNVQHHENPFKTSEPRPQHAALQASDDEPMVQNSDWLICMNSRLN